MIKYVCVALLSGILAAVAQALLKQSSTIKRDNPIREYLNLYVISGYGIMGLCTLMMIYAYKGMPYKYGPMLESLGYIYAMIIGRVIFKEKLTVRRGLGNLMIAVGVVIFAI